MARDAIRIIVTGRVQRVGYRYWTVDQARSLGVEGWARNREDGSVEILAIGSPEALATLAAACAGGPQGAVVADVSRSPAEDDGAVGFERR